MEVAAARLPSAAATDRPAAPATSCRRVRLRPRSDPESTAAAFRPRSTFHATPDYARQHPGVKSTAIDTPSGEYRLLAASRNEGNAAELHLAPFRDHEEPEVCNRVAANTARCNSERFHGYASIFSGRPARDSVDHGHRCHRCAVPRELSYADGGDQWH